MRYDSTIYQNHPQTVLGFHGCDKSIGMKILNSQTEHLIYSENSYDWLGDGIYFWLNDPQRAYEWALQTSKIKPDRVKEPFVIGAVIDLGLCLNLCERQSILSLQKSYNDLKKSLESIDLDINETYRNKRPDLGGFNLLRPLDCAVITHLHQLMKEQGIVYDSVYGYFQEGSDAFAGAGIKEKSHIQVCVRTKECIKGYFLPRI